MTWLRSTELSSESERSVEKQRKDGMQQKKRCRVEMTSPEDVPQLAPAWRIGGDWIYVVVEA